MKLKTLVLAGVLAIFTMSMAVAKTYDISFSSLTKAGSAELKPGDYRLSVNGNKATFTEVNTLKTVSTEVKVENTETKFGDTKVDTTTDGNATAVKDIELGGSKVKLDF
jgi:long-subunit fatty acid transport protein